MRRNEKKGAILTLNKYNTIFIALLISRERSNG